MAKNSNYCKAYYAKRFREFKGWKENTKNLRKKKTEVNGKEVQVDRTSLEENDILYLHDNYIVADGIFYDENVVFDNVTDEWKKFCDTVLNFQIPEHQRASKVAA